MTLSSLEALFRPKSIAVIGASDDKKIGGRPIAYLKKIGFNGKIYPINPTHSELQGLKAYPSILEVPEPVDLALISVRSSMVLKALQECAAKKVPVAIIFSAGFAEVGKQGRQMQEEIKEFARNSSTRILGPNSIGIINLHDSVIGTFASALERGWPRSGRIGVVSQSGAVGSHIFSWGREMGIGFSYWVNTGNEVDIDVSESIAFMAEDPHTDVIAVYLEGARDGGKLKAALELAREKRKPVVILKVGSSDLGAKAAYSHTASLVGSDAVYETLFRQFGVYRANTIQEFLDIVHTLGQVKLPQGNRVAVFTVSGGVGILLTDQLTAQGLELPEPSDEAKKNMLELVPFASVMNPIDVTGQLVNQPELLSQFMDITCRDTKYDLMIVFLSHHGLNKDAISVHLRLIDEVRERYSHIPVLISALVTPETKKLFDERGLPIFEDPSQTVHIAKALSYFGQSFQQNRSGTQISILPATNPGWSSGTILTEDAAKNLLSEYGIPVTQEQTAHTESEAVAIAKELGFPVVLKGMSPDILHKTDAGIVYLNVQDGGEVKKRFGEIVGKIRSQEAEYNGVLVQEMITGGIEVIVGTKCDSVFGPTVMVGLGGIYTEVLHDTAIRLAPLQLAEAEKMITELKAFPILSGVRGGLKADTGALAQLLVDISNFALRCKDFISDIDLNPVKVFPEGKGVKVVDALIIPRR